MNDLELKRKRIEMIAKVGGFLGVCLILAPLFPFIVAGAGALAALTVTAIVGLTVINFLPWFAMKLANWKLKALKAEAAANPIETMENLYKEKESALVQIRSNLQEFHGVVQSLYDEIQEHNRNYPNRPSSFQEKYEKMKELLALRGAKYKQAQANLKKFSDLIDEKRSDWKVAQAAAKASKLANVGEDFMSKLMADTAVDSVQSSLNTAFAELEVSLLDEQTDASVTTVTVSAAKPVQALAEKSGPPVLDLDFSMVDNRQKISVS